MEVPDALAQSLPVPARAERIESPGAVKSGLMPPLPRRGPREENSAKRSAVHSGKVEAATLITAFATLGDETA